MFLLYFAKFFFFFQQGGKVIEVSNNFQRCVKMMRMDRLDRQSSEISLGIFEFR